MQIYVGTRAVAFAATLLFGGALAAQKMNTSPFELDDPDRPSNGVLLLSAEAVRSGHPKGEAPPPLPNGRQPWEGALILKLTNISPRIVTLDVSSPVYSFYYEVWDTDTRLRVNGTPQGERVAALRGGPLIGGGDSDTLHMAPGESYEGFLDLARLFRIKVGEHYAIKIRRTLDSKTTDELGKPLTQERRDLTCTIHILGEGVEK